MKIITRYILREFLKPFFMALMFFSVVILIIQVFNDMKLIMDHKPGILLAVKYFTLQIPELLIRIIPLAVLFAVLFALGGLAKTNELLAMRAGGVHIFMVAVPLFFCGLIVCLISIAFDELVVPKTTRMMHHAKVVEIEKQPEASLDTSRQNISLRGANNQIYHIGSFDGLGQTMKDVLVLDFQSGVQLKSRIDAKSAKYEKGRWVFYDGYYRAFNNADIEVTSESFDRRPFDLPEKPSDFLKEQKEAGELNLPELVTYIQQLRRNGSDCHKELVILHKKLAFPFGCVILAVLGVPWGWGMGKYSGVMFSLGICILVAFFYLGGMQIGEELGYSGFLTPFYSMWTMNIIFAIGGPLLLIRKNQ